MIQLDAAKFIVVAILVIAFLLFDGFLLKKFKTVQEYLIPVILVCASIVISLLWCYTGAIQEHFIFYMFIGIIKGFAAIGIYQFYKQLKRQFQYRKMKKIVKKDRRSRIRKVS